VRPIVWVLMRGRPSAARRSAACSVLINDHVAVPLLHRSVANPMILAMARHRRRQASDVAPRPGIAVPTIHKLR
jgi:hypothetical protein